MTEQSSIPDAPSHWIFQGNPNRYDLRDELKPGVTEGWLASRYATRMRPGDVVWLWRSGERAIYGWGTLAGRAERDARDGHFWVPVEYRVRFAEPIELVSLRSQPDLVDLTILRAPQGTNFAVAEDQARALVELARTRGLEAPEPVKTWESGPFVPIERSPLLNRLFQRLKGRSKIVAPVAQCVDLLAALFAEGESATVDDQRQPATIWLHQVLSRPLQSGPDAETERSSRISPRASG
jgi:hypothetical protein